MENIKVLESKKVDLLNTLGNDDLPREFELKLKADILAIDEEISICKRYEEMVSSGIPSWLW